MENRERILACALELFYQKGYDAVGIQEVCQTAGITKPTLYHYFGSKFGLLETLLEHEFGNLMQSLTEASRAATGVHDSLYAIATTLIDFANANTSAYMLLMSFCYSARESETYQAVRPYMSCLYNHAVQVFERAAKELGNMNGRQDQFAIGFLGLINHYILMRGYQNTRDGGFVVSEETKRRLIHQFMHGIYS